MIYYMFQTGSCSEACITATLIISQCCWHWPFLESMLLLLAPLLLLPPFSVDLKSPQSAGISQSQLLTGSETEPNTCYTKGIPGLRQCAVWGGVPCVGGGTPNWHNWCEDCNFPLFSSTDAFDSELIMQTLRQILQGETVQIPVYDFVTHSRWATIFVACGKCIIHKLQSQFVVNRFLIVVFVLWLYSPIIISEQVINVLEETFLCVIPGKKSLLQYIQLMWSCLRVSSCSTLRKSETSSRWSCLSTQTQTHGSHAEVCVCV